MTTTYNVPKYRLSLVREGTTEYSTDRVGRFDQAVELVSTMLRHEPVENVVVIYLNGANKLIGTEVVSRGGLHGCAITPAEIFRGAIVACASAIILAHNHPSGDPTPSRDDIEMTRMAARVGKDLGIEVLDHVIVTREGPSASLREHMVFP